MATRRNRWLLVVGLIVVTTVITMALASRMPKSASSPPESLIDTPPGDDQRAERKGARGEADGALPDGVTVFDDEYPAVAKLNLDLLGALREAARDAAGDIVKLYINSGWRSPERQNQLLREAVSKYGSVKEAARWVATAATSPHRSGDAVDIGRSDATAWLSEHGAQYGLCQIYRNEPWHYELRTNAIKHGCPRMYANPTQDPRMQ